MVKRKTVKNKKKISVRTKKTCNYWNWFLFGLGFVTFLAIGLPLALWVKAEEADLIIDTQDTDLLLVLAGQEKINEKINAMMQKMDSLNKFDDASVDCWNQCRLKQSLCLETEKIDNHDDLLNICSQRNQDCIEQCDEKTKNKISCQDYCAISFGGCIERALIPQKIVLKDERNWLDLCVNENLNCLQKKCDFTDDAITQNGVCLDQCQRFRDICQSGRVIYDEKALDICERLIKVCEYKACGV